MLIEEFTDNRGLKYEVEERFIHYDTRKPMYRIKRIFKNGALDFLVWEVSFLDKFRECGFNWDVFNKSINTGG